MKNNLIFIIFDSCRYDSFVRAKLQNITRIAAPERRYSFASWTLPSHHVYMMGASPHKSPKGVFASEVYKQDFLNWGRRLNIPEISFKAFVPKLSLTAFLQSQGYLTHGLVSLPVLNQATAINNHFNRYQLMKAHNDFEKMLDLLVFEGDKPSFYLLNLGETHYPYCLPGETTDTLPRIHGAHGVFKHLDDLVLNPETGENPSQKEEVFFNTSQLEVLHRKQITNVEYLDRLFQKLFDIVPQNTYFIVTSDHGECFGEEGYFGHGPVMHEKVFEVFFLEGMRP
jgi:hypothetical protein